jgi:steroid delta-isomerase-like uncharacterized protein
LKLDVRDVVINGERAAVTWILRGTHHGELMNIPATGRRVEVSGTTLLTVEDGRIQAAQRLWDVAGLLRILGVLPGLPLNN